MKQQTKQPPAGKPPIIRIADYVRVSGDDRLQENSDERQLTTLACYRAARPHYKLVKSYVDLEQKGWRSDRDEFQQMLADARAGLFDRILIDQGSRLSRQQPMEFFVKVAWPLQEAGVEVESVQHGRVLDWNNVGDFIISSVDQFRSNTESIDTSWRVLGEWVRRAQKGQLFLGKRPYGYTFILDGKDRRVGLAVHEEEAKVVRYLFDAYGNQDRSLREIAAELQARGTRPPRGSQWRQTSLARWLRDPLYLGTYRFNVTHYGKYHRSTKEGVEDSPNRKLPSDRKPQAHRNSPDDWIVLADNHEAIIEDAELFTRVQEKLVTRRRMTTPGGHSRRDFLLAGLLVCGQCGSRLTGHRPMRAGTAGRKTYPVVYRCAAGYDAGKCRVAGLRESELLPAIVATVESMLSEERLGAVRERAALAIEAAVKPQALDPLKAERESLSKKIDRARRNLALLETDEDVAAVNAELRAWRLRVAEIDAHLGEALRPQALDLLAQAIAECQKALWDLREAVTSGDPARQRATLRGLLQRVVVHTRAETIGKGRQRHVITGGQLHLGPHSAVCRHLPPPLVELLTGGEEPSSKSFSSAPSMGQVSAWSARFASAVA